MLASERKLLIHNDVASAGWSRKLIVAAGEKLSTVEVDLLLSRLFRFKAALIVCSVAERPVGRLPTAAEGHGRFVGIDRECVAVVVQHFDAAGDEKRAVGANFDADVGHEWGLPRVLGQ